MRGITFAAWTLAAFAIGTLAGMLIRRVTPAIANTRAAYAGLAFGAGLYLRQRYLPPVLARELFKRASRFWAFQWIESGWLFALTVLLIAATIWPVRRRAA